MTPDPVTPDTEYVEGDGDIEVYAQFLVGKLPLSPDDLLTNDQKAALAERLALLARLRRTADDSGRMA